MVKTKGKKEKVLTLKPLQELFCQYYAGYGERSLMSNGVMSYIAAFEIDTPSGRQLKKWKVGVPAYWDYTAEYKAAKSAAHLLLTNPHIKARIYILFKTLFSSDVVDSELLSTIMQSEDKAAKVAAIREFNALKGRITKKIKLSGELKSNIPPERLAQIAAQILKASKKK